MHFDKESKSEDFFFFFWWREGGGSNLYSLIFVLMLYIKFQVPSASGSLVLTETNESRTGKRHNSANVLQNSVKSHLYIDPKQYFEFQDPSSSNSLDIVLTRFSYCHNSTV